MVPRALRIPTRPAEDDIVPDSEPEREQRRQQHADTRRLRRKLSHSQSDSSVVVLSSDEDNPRPLYAPRRTVVEISDSSDIDRVSRRIPPAYPISSEHNGVGADNSESCDGATRLPSVREILGLPRNPLSASPTRIGVELPPLTATTRIILVSPDPLPVGPELSPPPRHVRPLDLARFAYTGSSRSLSRASSRAPSGRSTPAMVPPPPLAVVPTTSTSSNVATSQPLLPSADPKGSERRKAHRSAVLDGISDTEVAKLRKCVSCDLAWTARKTAPQKSKHITSCAKKYGLTPETVQHLVRAELRRIRESPPEVGSKGKNKAKKEEDKEEEDNADTLLTETIDGGTRRKPGRRPAVVETVRELTETRSSILERARLLLGSTAKPSSLPQDTEKGEGIPPRTQPFDESALARTYRPTSILHGTQAPAYVPSPTRAVAPLEDDEDDDLPKTQPFGGSGLAERFGKALMHHQTLHDGDEPVSPPRTQPFGESALAKRFGTRKRVTDDAGDSRTAGTASPERQVFSVMSNSSPIRGSPGYGGPRREDDSDAELWLPENAHTPGIHSSNANTGRSRMQSPSGSLRDVPPDDVDNWDDIRHEECEYDYNDEWENVRDDAVIHYDPDNLPSDASSLPSSEDAPICTQSAARTPASRRRTSKDPALSPKPKRKGKSKKTSKRAFEESGSESDKNGGRCGELSDDALHAALHARIVADAQLYAKILRYEPVPFATFLALAADLDTSPTRAAPTKPEGRGKGKGKKRADENTSDGECGDQEKDVSGRFRLRVRDFLDAQAIHFYGDTVGRAKTRRSRR